MTKYFHIDCKEVGFLDCDFVTEAETVELVIERCAEHGQKHHDLKGFGPDVYARMRTHIRTVERDSPP